MRTDTCNLHRIETGRAVIADLYARAQMPLPDAADLDNLADLAVLLANQPEVFLTTYDVGPMTPALRRTILTHLSREFVLNHWLTVRRAAVATTPVPAPRFPEPDWDVLDAQEAVRWTTQRDEARRIREAGPPVTPDPYTQQRWMEANLRTFGDAPPKVPRIVERRVWIVGNTNLANRSGRLIEDRADIACSVVQLQYESVLLPWEALRANPSAPLTKTYPAPLED